LHFWLGAAERQAPSAVFATYFSRSHEHVNIDDTATLDFFFTQGVLLPVSCISQDASPNDRDVDASGVGTTLHQWVQSSATGAGSCLTLVNLAAKYANVM